LPPASEPIRAIRETSAVTRSEHVTVVRVDGPDAFDAIDRVCPRELFVQDGQLLHTVFLTDDAAIFADVYVCRDEDEFLILSEGPSGDALVSFVRDAAPRGARLDVRNLSLDHRLLTLSGPYAWEVMAELAGPEVIGLPYLTFYYGDEWTCFRTGKTGEFGYDLLVDYARADALWARLLDLSKPFDGAEARVAHLDDCALENGFFSVRHEGVGALDPVALQLQWRVSYRKRDYPGATRLARLRTSTSRRTAHFVSERSPACGAPITLDGSDIGKVLTVRPSQTRGGFAGLALLDRRWAHPHVDAYLAGGLPIRTASAPLLNNRSLYVNPQRHSYATRHEESYPPLVTEGSWLASLIEPSS
jgi:aminomethyltransferase